MAATIILFLHTFITASFSIPIGDRVAYYISRFKDTVTIKIEQIEPQSPNWKLEQVFWAFDKPVDNCIPITVYSHPTTNGHGITKYGHENIIFWFFAYDSTDHSTTLQTTLTQYSVYQNPATFHIWKTKDINISTLSSNTNLLFTFYAFEYDDKYIQNISVHNCDQCNLQPPFQSTIYSYYLIVPDDAKNVYFTTNPSENVRFIFDDPTYLLTEQETLEKKVNQIVSYNVGAFENVNSLKMEDIEKVMLSFYNENQIDNNTINKYMNISLFQWISEFVQDDTVHNLIETKYKNLSAKIESINNRETLDSDGLLHEPWTPITVDIHYDLHHYRIFVIRKSGEFDLKQFKKTMELNKNAYVEHSSRKCPDISIDAIVDSDIPEWWDRIRVWVVSCTVLIVMATYICYDRYSYFQLVKKHIPENQTKGG
eukprot:76485_1